jgi:hypothetical protein
MYRPVDELSYPPIFSLWIKLWIKGVWCTGVQKGKNALKRLQCDSMA